MITHFFTLAGTDTRKAEHHTSTKMAKAHTLCEQDDGAFYPVHYVSYPAYLPLF
jgi:hypothetical protein